MIKLHDWVKIKNNNIGYTVGKVVDITSISISNKQFKVQCSSIIYADKNCIWWFDEKELSLIPENEAFLYNLENK